MKKALKYVLWLVLLLFLSIAATLVWLISTDNGLKILTEQAQQWAPGELEVKVVEGRLLDKFRIGEIHYQMDDLNVQLGEIQFEWQPADLFNGTLHIASLHLNDLHLQLPPSTENAPPPSKEPFELPDIKLPITVQIDDVLIQRVTIVPHAAEPIHLQQAQLQARVDDSLKITTLTLQVPQKGLDNLSLNGELGLQSPHPLDIQLNWAAQLPETGKLNGNGTVSGNMQKMQITHQTQGTLSVSVDTTVENVLTAPHWDGSVRWSAVHWPLNMAPDAAQIRSPGGELQSEGSLDAYQFTLNTDISGEGLPDTALNITAQGNLSALTLKKLQADMLSGHIIVDGEAQWQPALSAALNLQLDAIQPQSLVPDWPADTTLDGAVTAIFADQKLTFNTLNIALPPSKAHLQGKGNVLLEDNASPRFDIALDWSALRWPLGGGVKPMITTESGTIHASGTPQDYALTLNADVLSGHIIADGKAQSQPSLSAALNLQLNALQLQSLVPDWPAGTTLDGAVTAIFADQKLTLDTLNITLPPSKAHLQGKGNVLLEDNAPPRFDIALDWSALRWPLGDVKPMVITESGMAQASGTPQDYALTLNLALDGDAFPTGQWQLTGQGSDQQLNIKSLNGQTLEGELTLDGQVTWQPTASWQLALQGDGLNPGIQWPEATGKLALQLNTEGKLDTNGKLSAAIDLPVLKGRLRDQSFSLQSRAKADGNHYNLESLTLDAGNNRLRASGTMNEKLMLDWAINAPELAKLYPDLGGQITGQGQVSGTLTQPMIKATLNGNDLHFADQQIAKITADVNVALQPQAPFEVKLKLEDVQSAGKTLLKQLSINGDGQVDDHSLHVDLDAEQGRLKLALSGGMDVTKQSWRGALQKLQVDNPQLGTWALNQSASLQLSPTAAALAQSCLRRQSRAGGELCLQGDWRATADSKANLTLTAVPLSLASPFLPETLSISGDVNGTLAAHLPAGGEPQADADISISSGEVQNHFEDEVEHFIHRGADIKLNLQNGTANLKATLRLLEQSQISSDINLQLTDKQPLKGSIKGVFADLSIIPTFSPQVENTSGQVDINLKLGGTLGDGLRIAGGIQAQDISADLPLLGLKLREVNAKISGTPDGGLELNAGLRSGDGQAMLKGNIQFGQNDLPWQAALTLTSDRLQVINTPDALALASLDINTQLDPGSVRVRGNVVIPEAVITPQNFAAGAVHESADVVIVKPENTPEVTDEDPPGMKVDAQVRVTLGEDVSLSVMDFNSYLAGSLIATSVSGEVTTGSGTIRVLDGTFKAYGQDLSIDEGQIIFSGGPIANPGLSIEAVREVPTYNVTAGVKILGSAQNPRLEIFSRPAMNQTNALSFLMLGRPSNSSSGAMDPAGMATSALGGALTERLGSQIGLDEAEFSNNALRIGKYLSPRLYVGYGVGLFDNARAFNLRYDLSKNLKIEAEAGTQSGVDLSYSIEK